MPLRLNSKYNTKEKARKGRIWREKKTNVSMQKSYYFFRGLGQAAGGRPGRGGPPRVLWRHLKMHPDKNDIIFLVSNFFFFNFFFNDFFKKLTYYYYLITTVYFLINTIKFKLSLRES